MSAQNRRLRASYSGGGVFLNRPLFTTNRSFSGDRLEIELYTEARARSPREKDVAKWKFGSAFGGILIINGKACEYPTMGINGEIPHG